MPPGGGRQADAAGGRGDRTNRSPRPSRFGSASTQQTDRVTAAAEADAAAAHRVRRIGALAIDAAAMRSTVHRWYGPGPWHVRAVLHWPPLPGLAPRWRAQVPLWSERVASGDAALRLARRRLALAERPRRWLATLADLLDLRRELEIRDRTGRCLWRGDDVDALRAAAREAAGWGTAPPRRAPAPEPPEQSATGLSAAQRSVVEHPGGPALVLAVAGAGKTTTMVARVAALVAGGVPPQRILVTSFSRAAVSDVRAKLRARAATALDQVEVRTFHALAHALLREGTEARPRASDTPPSPPPEQVAERVLELTLTRLRAQGHALAGVVEGLDVAAFLAYRGRCLAALELPDPDALALPRDARHRVAHARDDPEQPLHRPLLREHERLRRDLGWRDYDDMIVDAWALLSRDPDLRGRLRGRWLHRIVDECQDVNPAQVALLEALLDERREVMLVGDDDQSIYGFRGSDPSLMLDLGSRLGARTYLLDHNYRSRPEPLAAAAALLQHVPGRAAKQVRPARPRGGVVTLDRADDREHEAALCAERLRSAHADGVPWCRQAVLLRRFDQAPVVETALLRAGVPYLLVGAPDVRTHPLARAALAALHLTAVADAPHPVRERAWRQWLRGLGVHAGRARELAAQLAATGAGGAEAAETWPGRAPREAARVRAATARVREAMGNGAAAALAAAEHALLPWPRYGRDAASVRVLRTLTEEGVLAPPGSGVADLLESLTARRRHEREGSERVLVTSAHRSKGLEWEVVVVPGQALGTFPQRDDPEERRLAYVAWTRARERLHLLYDAGAPPSPFLRDADVIALIALQDDLAWREAGVGRDSTAASWALADARRRLWHEDVGTPDPRRSAGSALGSEHAERRARPWHGSPSPTRAARGTRGT